MGNGSFGSDGRWPLAMKNRPNAGGRFGGRKMPRILEAYVESMPAARMLLTEPGSGRPPGATGRFGVEPLAAPLKRKLEAKAFRF